MNVIRVEENSRIGRAILAHPQGGDHQVGVTVSHGHTLVTIPGGWVHQIDGVCVNGKYYVDVYFEEMDL